MRVLAALLLLSTGLAGPAFAQAPVAYRVSFPRVEQRLMQVEVTFPDVPPGVLEIRMSRSSPGRYALHEFAKNVFDVRVTDLAGQPLAVTRPSPHAWDVREHPGDVRVSYQVYGDRVDGTYLAIDTTHAHINMPAAFLWARGLEDRAATIRFERPPGSLWQVATQLYRGGDAFSYTAPNLQYLMDSPTELGRFTLRTFTVQDASRTPVFRVAVHHTGTDDEADALVRNVEDIVRETRWIFGEYPAFETNTYTFIADYGPWAHDDGMEHRNSTILTSPDSIGANRLDLVWTIAHEFFHAWNVERIRPRSLEPFDFERENVSDELWFAEGFTSYYGPLVTKRAGVTTLAQFAREMGDAVSAVVASPGRTLRSAVEMSQLAPLVDAATANDPTAFANTYLSYYTWGSAIGLGLDLALRDRSDGRASLDDVMRVMWERFGRPGSQIAGVVSTPYTRADLESVVAEVGGDTAFARDFFARYVEGREALDYAPLLARAGLLLRPVAPGRGFAGVLALGTAGAGVRVTADVPLTSPAFEAGLARGDVLVRVGGSSVSRPADVESRIGERKPGDPLPVEFDRGGTRMATTLRLIEDPRVELVAAEDEGQTLTEAQRAFRDAWLSSANRSRF